MINLNNADIAFVSARQDIVFSLIPVPIKSGLRGFCLFILIIFLKEYQQKNPLKYHALPFLSETDSERIPQLAARLASEYDKENFLTLRYPEVLLQGSSFVNNIHFRLSGFAETKEKG